MGLFRVLSLFKILLLLSMLAANYVSSSTGSSNFNFHRKLNLTIMTKDVNDITSSENVSPPPQPPPPPPAVRERSNMAPFKPSIAVIVGVLTTMFSITFLLLLYAKHCKRGNFGFSSNSRGGAPPAAVRKNSGVDRTVIESLPIFRFGSLRGEKDGLECAVCLNRFESMEVLRLLPKCKHAFHVECVDTWLDAHSTCPLCRYRVEPEDILLIGDEARVLEQNEPLPPPPPQQRAGEPPTQRCEEDRRLESLRRVSGRHSSAGEGGAGGDFLQIVLQRPSESSSDIQRERGGENHPLTARRSLDSWNMRKKKKMETTSVGCFDRQYRKDGLLLMSEDRTSSQRRRRLEHRIIVGDSGGGGGSGAASVHQQRWSDVHPSDLLYLRSEMILSDSRRLSASSSRGSRPLMNGHQQHQNHQLLRLPVHNNEGRGVINERSVSEITGLSRFGSTGRSNDDGHHHHHDCRQHREEWRWRREERQAGLVSRWLQWISQSQPEEAKQQQQTLPAVRSADTDL